MAIAALLIVSILVINGALALYFMTKDVNISGGVVATVGTIEVYESDGETILSIFDYPNFQGGYPYSYSVPFLIHNTGVIPVCVYWNLSTSSIDWTWDGLEYVHNETTTPKYKFSILQGWSGPVDRWDPDIGAIYLLAGEGAELEMKLVYTGEPNTSETFTLTESFYAYDS